VSTHRADNEEEALNLLFLGDTNKAITETPMNQASSRSHCIFTMQVERRLQGSDTVRRAKVNLVDLAGSERVHKMGLDGQTLMEAKHINLSLHALEQVVVALQEGPGRSHIPYRNSMMTMMLKDSLGGNCRTVMIATASPRGDHLLEGISTCRFAQRIAMVTNEAVVNEEVDPALIIKRLKMENRELKDELRILRGDNDDGRETLTESEIDQLRSRVADYCKLPTANEEPTLELGASMLKIKAAIKIFREIVLQGGGVVKGVAAGESGEELRSEVKRLELVVKQRDDEIDILVSMLHKGEGGAVGAKKATEIPCESRSRGLGDGRENAGEEDDEKSGFTAVDFFNRSAEDDRFVEASAPKPPPRVPDVPFPTSPGQIAALVADRTRAFEHFKANDDRRAAVEENKVVLKNKFEDAKTLGEGVHRSKGEINRLKGLIEQMRQNRAAIRGRGAGARDVDGDEERLVTAIDAERAAYRAAFDELRDAKREIETMQKLAEQSSERLANDFTRWFDLLVERHGTLGGDSPPGSPTVRASSPVFSAAAPSMSPLGDATNSPKVKLNDGPSPKGAPSTGNAQADADIQAFYEARERLLRMRRESELLA
jgi:kinesin family protein 6/9